MKQMMRLLASRLAQVFCVQFLDGRILVGFADCICFIGIIEYLCTQAADIYSIADIARLLRLSAAEIGRAHV